MLLNFHFFFKLWQFMQFTDSHYVHLKIYAIIEKKYMFYIELIYLSRHIQHCMASTIGL